MFFITDKAIEDKLLEQKMILPQVGAFVGFQGWVRSTNEGKKVSSLEYEVFAELALKEAHKILNEAKEKFNITDAQGVHREGLLEIGEMAVWIGVTSAHREAAFQACRYIIDEVKCRLPVWKKEHYLEEEPQWVNCQGCYNAKHGHPKDEPSFTESDFYAKQIKLPSMGSSGQLKLKESRVLVVGAGGLGCPALSHLIASGVGQITICDGDLLEPSNLHRQTLYSYKDIGKSKALLAKTSLEKQNPFINIQALQERLTPSNAQTLIEAHDLVLDCTDNFQSKFLIHDACHLLSKPLVQASIYQYEGQLQSYLPNVETGCLRCLWAEVPDSDCVGNCADVGVLGAVPGALGTLQALEAIKILLKMNTPSETHTVLFDLLSLQTTRIKRSKNSDCPLCGTSPKIKDFSYLKNDSSPWAAEDGELCLSTLSHEEISQYDLVDIRNQEERCLSNPWEQFLTHIPQKEFLQKEKERSSQPPDQRPTLIVCQKGQRSARVVKELRLAGHTHVFSLVRGMESVRENWSRICP